MDLPVPIALFDRSSLNTGMEKHIIPRKTYFIVYLALLILLAATVGIAYLEVGTFNLVLALLIAFTKAALVVLFFMHVLYSTPLTKVFVLTAILFLILLAGLIMADYLTRTWGFFILPL
jgi:cytochrome c oxidase subunit IV